MNALGSAVKIKSKTKTMAALMLRKTAPSPMKLGVMVAMQKLLAFNVRKERVNRHFEVLCS